MRNYSRKDVLAWKTANFIRELGQRLELPEHTIATATVLMHKFFALFPFEDHNRFMIATACLFLACKSEDNLRRLRDLVNIIHYMLYPTEHQPIRIGSEEYFKLKDIIGDHEQIVLRGLLFDIEVELPYIYLLNYVKALRGSRELAKLSWNIVNDTLRTDMCLRYEPHIIAVAAIYLASRMAKISLSAYEPEVPPHQATAATTTTTIPSASSSTGNSTAFPLRPTARERTQQQQQQQRQQQQPWWEVFDANKEKLEAIIAEILDLYEHPLSTPAYAYLDAYDSTTTPAIYTASAPQDLRPT